MPSCTRRPRSATCPTASKRHVSSASAASRSVRNVGYTIAFVGFQAAPEHQSLAATFGAATLEHLTRTHPANVTLVERFDLQMILNEQNLDVSALVGPNRPVETGTLQDVDALLVGQVLEGKVAMDSKLAGYGDSTYQEGYRPEPNPDHIHAAKELDAAVQELEHARKRLAEAEAKLARYSHINPADPDEVEASAGPRLSWTRQSSI